MPLYCGISSSVTGLSFPHAVPVKDIPWGYSIGVSHEELFLLVPCFMVLVDQVLGQKENVLIRIKSSFG